MDVESTSDIGDWKDNAIVFKLETKKGTPTENIRHNRPRQVKEYLMDTAGVSARFFQRMDIAYNGEKRRKPHGPIKDYVMAILFDADAVKKCKEKIECQEKGTEIYEKVMNNLDPERLTMLAQSFKKRWNDRLNSRWVFMENLNPNTTRKQIIDHIKKNGNIKVKKKDIYIGQTRIESVARIECPSNSDAQKLVQTLSISELNGSKIFMEMGPRLEVMGRTVYLDNLDEEVTKQDIADLVQKCGKLETPPKYINVNVEKNHGNIQFDSNKDMVQTVRNLNISKLKGREVFIRWVQPGLLLTKWQYRKIKDKRAMLNVPKMKVERKIKLKRKRKVKLIGRKGWTKPRHKIKSEQ